MAIELLEQRKLLSAAISWSDPPPDPRTFAFQTWVDKYIAHFRDYCANQIHTTTYYVSQAGSDSNSGLDTSHPIKTLAKAETLMADHVEIDLRQGDTWTESAGLNDNGHVDVKIGSYDGGATINGQPNTAKPLIDLGGANSWGIFLSGDGSYAEGIKAINCGTTLTDDWKPFQLAQRNSDVGWLIDCEGANGCKHTIGFEVSGGGGGVHGATRCVSSSPINRTGNNFNDYTDTGGETMILDNCVIADGSPNGANIGVYSHNGTGSAAMVIIRNLHIEAGSHPIGAPVEVNAPPAATITDSRSWEIGTIQDKQIGNSCILAPANSVRINCIDHCRPPAAVDSGNVLGSGGSGWAINCTYDLDLSDIFSAPDGNRAWTLFNTSQDGPSAPKLYNCDIHLSNLINGSMYFGFDQNGLSNGNTLTQGSELVNTILSTDLSINYHVIVGLNYLADNESNALYGFNSDSSLGITTGFDSSAVNRVSLPGDWLPGSMPDPTSRLYQAGAVLSVPLEYDQNMHARSLTTPSIGPLEAYSVMGFTAINGSFDPSGAAPVLKINFNSTVSASTVQPSDIVVNSILQNGSLGGTTSVSAATGAGSTATFTLPASTPDGNYRVTLGAGNVSDTLGNAMVSPYTFDFFVFAGDANHDRTVDNSDIYILSQNWLTPSGTFAQGDFNYDGTVDARDLGIIATHWMQTLAAPSPAPPLVPPIESGIMLPAPIIQPSGPSPQAVYLSDLTPTSATNGYGQYEKDRSNGEAGAHDGHTITLNGKTYDKGLGVHAGSTQIYNLNGQYTQFLADIGVDDEVGSKGSVIFQIYLDNVKVYDSKTMTGSSVTKSINLDVTGKKQLKLVVSDAGNGKDFDHADWAGARLVMAPTAAPTALAVMPAALAKAQARQPVDLIESLPV